MVLILKKKPVGTPLKAPTSAPTPAVEDNDPPFSTEEQDADAALAAAQAPKPPVKKASASAGTAHKPSGTGLSFLKKGKVAQETMAQEEKKIELKRNQIYRYWLPKDAKGDITFLDGNLVDGVIDVTFLHEHNVNMNGKWGNHFICTQDSEPCPICEGGGSADYVGVLTIIDHSEYTSKKDNKVHKDNIKLFVAKKDTIKLLQELAVKRGGLRGCRFDVMRTGDKSPNVGSAFDFTEKLTDAQLKQKFTTKAMVDGKQVITDKSVPVNYEQYFAGQYQPASELRKLGFGSTYNPVGSESGAGEDYQM